MSIEKEFHELRATGWKKTAVHVKAGFKYWKTTGHRGLNRHLSKEARNQIKLDLLAFRNQSEIASDQHQSHLAH